MQLLEQFGVREFSIFQSGEDNSLDRFVLLPADIFPTFTLWVFGEYFFVCHWWCSFFEITYKDVSRVTVVN